MSAGYGRTIYCYGPNGLQPGRALTGRAALAASLWRRFMTPRASLQGGDEELAFGYDVRRLLGTSTTGVAAQRIATILESEAAKDERIAAVAASVVSVRGADSTAVVTFSLVVTPADDTDTFALTLEVSTVDVQILGGLPS